VIVTLPLVSMVIAFWPGIVALIEASTSMAVITTG
jgi:hypothetical protein